MEAEANARFAEMQAELLGRQLNAAVADVLHSARIARPLTVSSATPSSGDPAIDRFLATLGQEADADFLRQMAVIIAKRAVSGNPFPGDDKDGGGGGYPLPVHTTKEGIYASAWQGKTAAGVPFIYTLDPNDFSRIVIIQNATLQPDPARARRLGVPEDSLFSPQNAELISITDPRVRQEVDALMQLTTSLSNSGLLAKLDRMGDAGQSWPGAPVTSSTRLPEPREVSFRVLRNYASRKNKGRPFPRNSRSPAAPWRSTSS